MPVIGRAVPKRPACVQDGDSYRAALIHAPGGDELPVWMSRDEHTSRHPVDNPIGRDAIPYSRYRLRRILAGVTE